MEAGGWKRLGGLGTDVWARMGVMETGRGEEARAEQRRLDGRRGGGEKVCGARKRDGV